MTEAVNGDVRVRCLEKPFGINEPQKLEHEEDAIFYGRLFRTNVTPQLIKFGRSGCGDIKINTLTFVLFMFKKYKVPNVYVCSFDDYHPLILIN